PLLIGGATTSRMHTAVKVAPHYSGPVVHVLDASRSVPVVSKLIGDGTQSEFLHDIRAEYAALREDHARKMQKTELISLEQARANRASLVFDSQSVTPPRHLGVFPIDDVSVATLRPYIDWNPFFITWQLTGKYPSIFDDE